MSMNMKNEYDYSQKFKMLQDNFKSTKDTAGWSGVATGRKMYKLKVEIKMLMVGTKHMLLTCKGEYYGNVRTC